MGESSMGRNVYRGAKRSWGKLSAGRKVYTGKLLEVSTHIHYEHRREDAKCRKWVHL